MHNDIYDRWRMALNLDHLLTEASHDVDAINQYLTRRMDQRMAKLSAEQTALGIIIGAIILLTGIFGMNIFIYPDAPELSTLMLILPASLIPIASVFFGLRYWRSASRTILDKNRNSSNPLINKNLK